MIDENLIEKATGQRIIDSGLCPRIIWANRDVPQIRPYLVLDTIPTEVKDETLLQTSEMWTGFLYVTVVTALNLSAAPGRLLLKQIGALFPSADRLTMDDGYILLVDGHPRTEGPYRDGDDYRLPMRIGLKTDNV